MSQGLDEFGIKDGYLKIYPVLPHLYKFSAICLYFKGNDISSSGDMKLAFYGKQCKIKRPSFTFVQSSEIE